ncbi:MAG: hypothetical protein HYS14_01710 [Candidatus Rokubacteria bacterium]|nr:hypothetical protein [Candidatus Rokubacteria bacterium]
MSRATIASKSTRAMAAELSQRDHPVTAVTVARVLRDLGYSLQAPTNLPDVLTPPSGCPSFPQGEGRLPPSLHCDPPRPRNTSTHPAASCLGRRRSLASITGSWISRTLAFRKRHPSPGLQALVQGNTQARNSVSSVSRALLRETIVSA